MSILQGFRESKAFKLIADMSVVHWVYTVGPAFLTSVVAAMRGRPLEDVLLYFFVVSAAVLVLVHYSQVLYAKWKAFTGAAKQIEQKQNRNWGLAVPLFAFIAVLV